MFAALLARLGFEAAAPMIRAFARPLLYLAAGLAFLAAVYATKTWDENRFEAVRADHAREMKLAIAARDLHWSGQIEQGNRLVAEHHAADLAAAMRDAEALRHVNSELNAAFVEMEKRNAQKPGGTATCLDAGDLDEFRRLWKRPR